MDTSIVNCHRIILLSQKNIIDQSCCPFFNFEQISYHSDRFFLPKIEYLFKTKKVIIKPAWRLLKGHTYLNKPARLICYILIIVIIDFKLAFSRKARVIWKISTRFSVTKHLFHVYFLNMLHSDNIKSKLTTIPLIFMFPQCFPSRIYLLELINRNTTTTC